MLQIPFIEKSEYALLGLLLLSVSVLGLLFFLAVVSGAEISYFSLSDKTIQSFKESKQHI